MRYRWIPIAAALLIVGCDKKTDTTKDKVETGERQAKLGEFKGAIRSYEAALDGTAKTAELHYRIALIYDDKLKDALDAIHHYDRYLELAPSGVHVSDSKTARKKCLGDLQMEMNKEGFMPQSQASKLRNENENLIAEKNHYISLLNEHKIPFKQLPPKATKTPEQLAKTSLPPGTREYKVKQGDTLASIAFTVYKDRGLSGHIKDANQVLLKGKDILHPGQVLIIPDRPRR